MQYARLWLLVFSLWAPSVWGIFPTEDWDRVPSVMQRGWDPAVLEKLQARLDEWPTTAFLIVENGRIVFSYGDITKVLPIADVRLACLNAIYGYHMAQQHFDLGATLGDLGVQETPPLTKAEKKVALGSLMESRHRIFRPAALDDHESDYLSPPDYAHLVWRYNTWGFNALASIFEKVTHEHVVHAFDEHIAESIQMEDFKGFRHASDVYSSHSEHRASTLSMSARDLARLGVLYANEGAWAGKQILPAKWVQRSTTAYSSPVNSIMDESEAGGFGWLWWVANRGVHFPGAVLPKGSYSARGEGGQYLVVIPAYQWVIVHLNNIYADPRVVTPTEFGEALAWVMRAKQPLMP